MRSVDTNVFRTNPFFPRINSLQHFTKTETGSGEDELLLKM